MGWTLIGKLFIAMSFILAISGTAQSAPPAPDMGVGIHPEDFRVFDLDGRLLFVDDRAVLSLIGTFEGPEGYDTVYNGSRVKPERPITTMTIAEVVAWQERSVAAGSKSTAAGVYQFIRTSLIDTAKKAGIPDTALFDRFTQDRMARSALRTCGFYRHDVADSVIGNCLAGTWAALPLVTGPRKGSSRYQGIAGNKSLTSVESVMATIRGRFRDLAYSDEIRRNPGAHSVQRITPNATPTAVLKQEMSASTGEYVFSVSEPDPAQVMADRKNRYQANLADRAQRLQPFSGYIRSGNQQPRRSISPRPIPVLKKDNLGKKTVEGQ